MRLIITLFLLATLTTGCRKTYLDGYQVFSIKQGKHSSENGIGTVRSDETGFEIRFDATAEYYTTDPTNQLDVNKLFGVSDCNSNHQQNSARFGWRWYNSEIEIVGYVYNDGIRKIKPIGAVSIGETHSYKLELSNDLYTFRLDDTVVTMERTAPCQVGYYYKLWPYFGGDETAPHDITIYMKANYF